MADKEEKEEEAGFTPPPVDNTPLAVTDQARQAERLQAKWLRYMEALLDQGKATSTDLATLARLLSQNGWHFDPAQLPKPLSDRLTSKLNPNDFEDEEGVLPFRRAAE